MYLSIISPRGGGGGLPAGGRGHQRDESPRPGRGEHQRRSAGGGGP